ncbi:MAG TPA: 2-oxoglutarate dehydrogenase E1 component [Leucothrix mucor]|nr:2-oxoglutarate dehydrogenase E1 component [Leucothrix mucor]
MKSNSDNSLSNGAASTSSDPTDSLLEGENAAYLELLFESYIDDPQSVALSWQKYFSNMPVSAEFQNGTNHSYIRQQFRSSKLHSVTCNNQLNATEAENILRAERQQVYVLQLIDAYRTIGHLIANTNPLSENKITTGLEELSLQHYGLDKVDSEREFNLGSFHLQGKPTIDNIYRALRNTYTGYIGVEYMHIMDREEKEWLQSHLEACEAEPDISAERKKEVYKQLVGAETLERYLHTKYTGQKRFSLEGGDSLIPLLHEIIHHAGGQKIREIILGMAHRGRLNVLINIMGKSTDELFKEFEGVPGDPYYMGDVKYHKGYTCSIQTVEDPMNLSLAFNPSHLEIVGPVVAGAVRARKDRRADQGGQVVAVVIHGDAAFAGQGVVMETLNMSQTRGYHIHGTVHIVINNQIGFTTSTSSDTRSTYYPTDVAKMVNAPILHVNGDHPEAVIFAAQIALDYRLRFRKDIVIDLLCYRKHGHNEADEPAVTQPIMYKTIRNKTGVREKYASRLIKEKVLTESEADQEIADYKEKISSGKAVVDTLDYSSIPEIFKISWDEYKGRQWTTAASTSFSFEKFQALSSSCQRFPESFELHPQVQKLLDKRHQMATGERLIDWGFAENMAYASLLEDGFDIRLSGQDSGRGTFSHRHVVFHHQDHRETHIPLKHLSKDQGTFTVIDSLLSEEAVLAFEYGYATSSPLTLVIWEAQFGDFANGAQVVIDQFITSGEQKWARLCGLTLFLPHGFEGMGAEHSSARLERYLQLCAQHNIQVCIPSTPAQTFHMLRRQMIRPYRRPLIVLTPKSLLRHPAATNELSDLTEGKFYTVIDDPYLSAEEKASKTRLILCSGKVYYDLLATHKEENLKDIAIVRLEQLYPFPEYDLKDILKQYKAIKEFVWCQEEPRNQGAWDNIKHRFQPYAHVVKISCVSRPSAAAPAVGSFKVHHQQQTALVRDALRLPPLV